LKQKFKDVKIGLDTSEDKKYEKTISYRGSKFAIISIIGASLNVF